MAAVTIPRLASKMRTRTWDTNADANLGHPGTRGLSGRDAERLADFDLVGIGQVVGLRDLGILVGVAIKQLADL